MPDTAPSKSNVKVKAWTFDPGDAGKTVDAFAEEVMHRVETAQAGTPCVWK